ncbi:MULTISPECIES: LLM class flavin-dependent oxidoreductase [Candidatus Nitrosocaldus]|jgi:alkanesulfonate monooxygenase SsuD/methylene tetrahydromethanopterin reductase-like flavin-dependent oxidoreductase (luciferase family)|nr:MULTISPECIES: LLM class flavin-dependent oxidoreductase [Candidatus Nitrosocaldus]
MKEGEGEEGRRRRIGISLGMLLDDRQVIEYARRAESMNLHSIWVPESWGRDAFVTLSYIASLTRSVMLGTAIVNIYARSAASTAMAINTLDLYSNGRAVLGLGAGSKRLAEDWHGLEFKNNIARMKEYVDVIRLISRGERVDYNGRVVKVKGMRLGFKPLRSNIPIYIAATNQGMLKLAGEVGDGAILFLMPMNELDKQVRMLKGINPRLDVALVLITAVSNDAQRAIERAKKSIAFYTAVGSIYARFLAEHGFKDEVEHIREEYRRNGLKDIHMLVSDRMLSSLALAGSIDDCIKQLRSFIKGIDLPILLINPVYNAEEDYIVFEHMMEEVVRDEGC